MKSKIDTELGAMFTELGATFEGSSKLIRRLQIVGALSTVVFIVCVAFLQHSCSQAVKAHDASMAQDKANCEKLGGLMIGDKCER